jgi:cytoskeletal protein RodZ
MHVRLLVIAFVSALLIPQFVVAQTPFVSPSELHQAMATASQTRQKNLDDVRSFFASESTRTALKTGKIDYKKVEKAVATLSPEELARLAEKTNQIQKDFAAGALTNQELTYIVIALGTAVLVILIVVA